jgi:hypothetical protein
VKTVVEQLRLQNNAGMSDELSEAEKQKKREFGQNVVNNSPYGKMNKDGDRYELVLVNHCSVISERAVFIAGLAQAGMMRFMPAPIVFPMNDFPANSFIFFTSMATALSFVSGFLLTSVEIFTSDTDLDCQLAYAINISPLAKTCFIGYIASFFCLAITIALMGPGTAYLPIYWNAGIYCGLASIVALLGGILVVYRYHHKISLMTDKYIKK